MSGTIVFSSHGQLVEWASHDDIAIADPPQSIWDWDPDADSATGVNSHPLREVTDFIASHISTLPLKVYRRLPDGGRERIRDNDLARLLADPTGNPAIPANAFWRSLIMDGLLADRFLAVSLLGADHRPHLKRIPPRQWRVVRDFYDEVIGVKVTMPDATTKKFMIEDNPLMILQVGYAFQGASGSPKRQRLQSVLDEYEASIQYRKSVNEHGLQAPIIIERDRPWPNDESRRRFQNSMKAFVAGGASAGGGMVLEDGMKASQLSAFKPIDVNDLDARDRVKIDVANAYGIPPEILGLRAGNYSNLESQRQMLYGVYLDPYIVALEQTLNACLRDGLMTHDKVLYIEFDRDAQLRGDPAAQYSAFSTATGRPFVTTNEVRSMINLPHIDGGDDLVTPLNVLTGGQTSPQDGVTAGRGGGELPQEEEQQP